MHQIKNLILDYNGVISDDFSLVFKGVTNIFEKHGLQPLSYERLREEYEIPLLNFYKKYIPNPDIDALNRYYFESYGTDVKPQPYPRVAEVAKSLRAQGIRMIILSSHDKNKIEGELLSFGIDPVVFEAIYGNVKDKRLVITEVLARHGFQPAETAYVGDTEHDIEVAKQAHVISIASTYGYKPRSKLEALEPDYYISNFPALLDIVSPS